MAHNKKLSQDIEEKIQALASDVYIQIEDKLTWLLNENLSKQANKIAVLEKSIADTSASIASTIPVEQDALFINLQNDYQALELQLTEFTQEKSTLEKNQAKTLEQYQHAQLNVAELENLLKEQTEREKSNIRIQSENLGEQLKNNQLINEQLTAEYSEQISTITHSLNDAIEKHTQLAQQLSDTEQQLLKIQDEQNITTNNHQKSLVTINTLEENITRLTQDLEQSTAEKNKNQAQANSSLDSINEQLLLAQKNNTELQQQVTEQQQSVINLKNELDQLSNKEQDNQQQISTLSLALTTAEKKQIEVEKLSNDQLIKIEKEKQLIVSQLEKIQQENNFIAKELITEQADNAQNKQEIESLKSQVDIARSGQETLLNRFNQSREKQESDNDKARETIKYLRDENTKISQETHQEISELKNKLTEYRLKFEYAQKKLSQS